MRQALNPKKHATMIGLLNKGHSVKVVSKWLEVVESYVLENSPGAVAKPRYAIGDLPDIDENPYKDFSKRDFISTDLKVFRAWVQKYMKPELLNNARRAMVLAVYEKSMKELEE